MAGVVQLVSSLGSTTGLPEDAAQNVIHLAANGPDLDVFTAGVLTNNFVQFWNTDPGPQTLIVGQYISEVISRAANACSVSAYFTNDLTGATPFGSPIAVQTFTLIATPDLLQMPEEVAAVISFNGDLTDVPQTAPNPTPPPAFIRPAQRRRGRMFIGPLSNNAGITQLAQWRPSANFRTDLGIAFSEFCNACDADTSGDFQVGVWSKADATVYPVVAGYVDDAWDTQRRRGLAATTRTTFTV